jgi:hypothetical protein
VVLILAAQAELAGVGPSTLARSMILNALNPSKDYPAPVATRTGTALTATREGFEFTAQVGDLH